MSVCRRVFFQIAFRTSTLVGEPDLAGANAFGFQLVQRDAVLEQHHQQERVDRVAQEVRRPGLVFAHPQDAVADVAVHPHDVGVGVMHVVVRMPPLIGGAGGVPLEGAAGDRRVTHPVVLTVHDVVADLHVVQDFRDAQHRGADQPGRRQEQQSASAHFQRALGFDDAADVVGVFFTEVCHHAFFDGVEFAAECVGLLGGQGDLVV